MITYLHQVFRALPLEQKKGFVFDLQVGERQFRRSVFILRRRHQFVDVLFQMNLESEKSENDEKGGHRQPAYGAMVLEIMVDPDEELGHVIMVDGGRIGIRLPVC